MKFSDESIKLERLPDLIAALESLLEQSGELNRNGNRAQAEQLGPMLAQARQNVLQLIHELNKISEHAERLANAMNFSFLFDKERYLMSIGYDAEAKELAPYYYDLLATEPRTAVFVAIAKDEIPQDAWFRLGRPFTEDQGPGVAFVDRHDVRVHDACDLDADLSQHAAGRGFEGDNASSRSMEGAKACRGEFPSRHAPSAIQWEIITTRRSEFRNWP